MSMSNILLLNLVSIFLVIVFIIIILSKFNKTRKMNYNDVANDPETEEEILFKEILALIKQNKYEEAIKIIQDKKSLSYDDAKAYIEHLDKDIVNQYSNIDMNIVNKTILELIDKDQKIAAIKYYRDKTGLGLADAKNYIDNMALNREFMNIEDFDEPKVEIDMESLNRELVNLIKSGKKIEAIKIYREKTGKNLKESKEYIDSL